jgi:hypothetical protein
MACHLGQERAAAEVVEARRAVVDWQRRAELAAAQTAAAVAEAKAFKQETELARAQAAATVHTSHSLPHDLPREACRLPPPAHTQRQLIVAHVARASCGTGGGRRARVRAAARDSGAGGRQPWAASEVHGCGGSTAGELRCGVWGRDVHSRHCSFLASSSWMHFLLL